MQEQKEQGISENVHHRKTHAVDFNSCSANFIKFRGPRLGLSVLVVSRDEEIRSSLAWVLKLFGCKHVLEATTAPGAATLIEHLPSGEAVGLVLCDMALAKDVLGKLSKIGDSGQDQVPMLMICEKRFNREEASTLIDAGVLGYITKPLRIQAIRGAVVKHILQGATTASESEHSIRSSVGADYERMETIGKGSFAEVILVRRQRDGICFAMKEMVIRGLDIRREKQVLTEMRLHTSFDFPFIVRTFSAWLKDHMAYLLMEYVESGPLSRLVSTCRADEKEISNESIISWCGQMLLGLMYLHQKEVLHRDLKLDNILGPDCLDRVKLADFGISRILACGQQPMSIVGTPMAMAPERYAKDESVLYGTQSDLWSLGVVLYELATLHPPFEAENGACRAGVGMVKLFEDIISSREPKPLPHKRPAVLHRIVTGGLLQKRPNDRPTCRELCQEPSISAAIHSFLSRHDLLRNAAVLEVIDVLPADEDAPSRIDCSQEEISTLRARDVSFSPGSLGDLSAARKKTPWKQPLEPDPNGGADLRDPSSPTSPKRTMTSTASSPLSPSSARGDLLLAEARWRLEERSKELLMAKNECVRLRRPMEVAQQQLLHVKTFSEPGALRLFLRFADPSKESQYLRAYAPRPTLQTAFGVVILMAVCGGILSLSREVRGCSHSTFKWKNMSGIFSATLVVATFAVALYLAFRVACGRSGARITSTHPRILLLRELTAAGFLSTTPLLAIFIDASLELKAEELCLDSKPVNLVLLIILPLAFGPRVLHVRWFMLLGVHAVVLTSYAVNQFFVDSRGPAAHESKGLILVLLAAVCLGLLLERRIAETGERLQFLISSGSETIAAFPGQHHLGSPRRSLADKTSSVAGKSGSTLSSGPGRSASSIRGFTKNLSRSSTNARALLGKSTSSLFSFSQKLLRAPSSASGSSCNSEDMFLDVEDANDSVTRSESLVNIRKQGEKEHWLLDNTNVRILQEKVLGCGGFGVVLQGELFGAPVAVKMPKSSGGEFNISDLSNELRVLRHVWHPNIVKFFGSCIDPGSGGMVVVLELLKGVQLDNFVCAVDAPPDVATRRRLLLDICRALCYMHAHKPRIVHGDLKGSNILVEMWLGGPRTKLLDFGLSRLLTTSKRVNPLGGTVNWMAPEIIRGHSGAADASADVFSFGRLAFMVVSGTRPLCDMSFDDIVKDAMNMIVSPLSWPLEDTPMVTECRHLANRCFSLSALMRPSMEEAHSEVQNWSIPGWKSETSSFHFHNAALSSGLLALASAQEGVSDDSTPDNCVTLSESLKSLSNPQTSAASQFLEYLWGGSTSSDNTTSVMDGIMVDAQACNRLIDSRRLSLMPNRVLGVNNFGFVVPGRLDGSLVAVRTTSGRLSSNDLSKSQDLRMLLVVKHPCIVALHGLCLESGNILAVLEWVEGVPLEIFVSSANVGTGRVLASTRHRLLQDIASALWYLHDQKPPIAHGGLTGSNIIVESRLAGPRAKLLDFGLSGLLMRMAVSRRKGLAQVLPTEKKRRAASNLWKAVKHSLAKRRKELVWSAPEALHARHAAFTTNADVFVFGRLAYLIITGREPLQSVDVRILEQAARKSAVVPPEWPDSCPDLIGSVPYPTFVSKCRPLCERCCIPNPLLRPTMEGVFHSLKVWMPLEEPCSEDGSVEDEPVSPSMPLSMPSSLASSLQPSTKSSLKSGLLFPSNWSNLESVPENDGFEEDDLPSSQQPTCPEGHTLVLGEDIEIPGITCNFCDRQLAPEVTWWSCGKCNMNICKACVCNSDPHLSCTIGPLLVRP